MTNGKVFVAGSLHYDIVVGAPHLPARDETVMGGPMRFVCGGKGGNQAVAASLHGADVAFGGMVGHDRFGEALLQHLRDAGVDVSRIGRTDQEASGASVAIVEETGEYGAVVASGANRLIDPDRIEFPEATRWLILQNEIPEPVNIELAGRARTAGARVILNAAPWRALKTPVLELADVLVLNRIEAEGLFGREIPSVDAAMDLLAGGSAPAECTIVTLGAHGLVYGDGNRPPAYLPAFGVKTISSHGAGDVFVGALSACLARGEPLAQSLSYASAAAALNVSTPVEERMSVNRERTVGFMASARRRA